VGKYTSKYSGSQIDAAVEKAHKTGPTDPTINTVGVLGQRYFNTTTGATFECKEIITVDEVTTFTWRPIIANSLDVETQGQALDATQGKSLADMINDIKGEGWTDETLKGLADLINDIKGEGWTDETLKGLADLISTKLDKTTSPNKNLLHNWDFRNPVNQRGQSSYTGTGYGTIDRWKVEGTATVSVTPDGVSFTPVTNSNLRQAIEGTSLAGKTVTMSVIFTSVSGTAAIIARDGSTVISSITTTSAGLVTNTFKVPENLSSLSVEINVALGSSFVAQSAKLELGSVSTLANDPPADYGEQLALCKRYYRLWTTDAARTEALKEVGLMRIVSPTTGTISINGTTYYYASADL